MATLISLQFKQPVTLAQVQALPGLRDVPLDADYGLVCISPRTHEYVVRTPVFLSVSDLAERRQLSPELGVPYDDLRIEPF